MTMLITPTYLAQQKQFHLTRPDYGTSSHKFIEPINALAKQLGSRDILDYGCGKAMLQKGLPFPIQNYDPAMAEYVRRPVPADIVVCTDVLEHIEPNCLAAVMDDLARLTRKAIFVNVACRPATKILPDGRNAHLIQETPNWWLTWFLPRFQLQSFQASSGDFIALLMPLPPALTETEAATADRLLEPKYKSAMSATSPLHGDTSASDGEGSDA